MRKVRALALALSALLLAGSAAAALAGEDSIPRIDCSTARIPIVDAIYERMVGEGKAGPEPLHSRTHEAWLNLADGAADILFLVAPTEEEFRHFREAGVDIEMKVYGYDGLVFLGNAANPVGGLTSSEIRAIYRGGIKNWNEIEGGQDAAMAVYVRDAESGSQRLFESLVFAGYELPDFRSSRYATGEIDPAVGRAKSEMTLYLDMDAITQSVYTNRYSIGFNIASYVDAEFLGGSGGAGQFVKATASVNMRDDPSLYASELGSLKSGTSLPYLGRTSVDDRGVEWYLARHESKGEVWISSKYSKLEGATESGLKLFAVDGALPTTENYASGAYPYLTTSYVAIRASEPEGSPARALYDWVGSEESRALIGANSTLSVAFSESIVLRTAERDPYASAAARDLIPTLDSERLTRDDLYRFTAGELALLRKGAFAISGKWFEDPFAAGYFDQVVGSPGVFATDSDVLGRMREIQRENLGLIWGYERELMRGNANRTERELPRTIRYERGVMNMAGEDVEAVQRALASQGYMKAGDVDGDYGRQTEAAVTKYQTDNGLRPTGEVDAETWMWLFG